MLTTIRSHAIGVLVGISLVTSGTLATAQGPVPIVPSATTAPNQKPPKPAQLTAPKALTIRGLDGKEHALHYRTFTVNTRPGFAKMGLSAPIPPKLNEALGNQGVKQGATILKPFGTKGESVSIAFGNGEYAPPTGEKIQAGLAKLAQKRLAQGSDASAGTSGGPAVYGLILINGPIDSALRANLNSLGVELLGFYPHSAYQARIPVAALNAVASLSQVRWIGQPNAAQKLAPELQSLVSAQLTGTKRQLLVNFFGEDRDGTMRAALQAAGAELGYYDARIAMQVVRVSDSALPNLVNQDSVLFIEPDRAVHTMNALGMTTINADWLWGAFDPSNDNINNAIKVGILDTGCYAYHNDFSNLIGGMAGFSLVSGENCFNDLNHHGTHVSGTILGEGNANALYRGVAAGLTSHSDPYNNPDYLVSQVFNQYGSGSGSTIIQAMGLEDTDYSAGFKRQVINMSGGGGGSPTDDMSRKADQLFGDNIVQCYAAGNSGPGASTVISPGCAKGAIAVGSIYNNTEGGAVTDTITNYSSRGPSTNGSLHKPDIVSPGSYVDSVLSGTASDYTYDWEGTSMATPHVTGVTAGLIGHYNMPAWATKSTLLASAIDLGYDRNTQGLGKVDAMLANYTLDGGWATRWNTIGGNGSIQYYDIYLGQSVAKARIVMTYPDPPAASGASFALINDLDLYVQYSADGSTLTTDLGYNWVDANGNDPVSYVDVYNAPAGWYRVKIYSYNVPTGSQAWASTFKTVNTSLNPNIVMSLNLPYAVQPNSSFYAQAYATPNAYVASGVVAGIGLPSSGSSLDGVWFNRQSKPSSGNEWFWFPNPWSSGGYYEVPQMNMGNIPAGYTRQMWWTLHGTSEGVKTVNYSVNSVNGGTGTVSGQVIVDGTAPTMGTPSSQNWTQSLSCDVNCAAQDTLSGLDPSNAYYRYSTNAGSTWNGWYSAACSGGYGSTAAQTLTASAVPFGQNNAGQNLIQFAVYDAAGNLAYSAITGVSTATPTKITLSPATVAGSLNVTGKVYLTAAAPTGGAVVALTNTNAAASVPGTMTVPAGATVGSFTITTTAVSSAVSGSVTATYGGIAKSATLKVRPISVKSITLTPTSVTGGSNVAGKVTLEAPAGPGAITVTLSSSNAAVAHPTVASITIAAGATTGNFTVATSHVSSSKVVTITATANGLSKTKNLTVNP